MITPKAKYFLIACGFCFLIILTLNQTNEGIIYHKIVQNLTERFYLKGTIQSLTTTLTTTLALPVVSVFPNVSKSIVTQASAKGIYMFTAFKRLVKNGTGTVVYVNGWEDKSLKKETIIPHCCFLLPNGSIFSEKTTTAIRFIYNPKLEAVIYGCNTPAHIKVSDTFAVSIEILDLKPAPPVKKTALPVKAPPGKKPAPASKGKKPMPPASGKKAAPAKSAPAGPVKNPKMSDPAQKTNKSGDTPNSEKTAVNNTDNEIAYLNASETTATELQNISSKTGRKLLSVKHKNTNNVKQVNITNVSTKQTKGNNNKVPVIKTPLRVICPTEHNSYVLPLQAIELPGEKIVSTREENVTRKDNITAPTSTVSKGQQNFSFAICAKLIYGDPDLELTIEWLEYYRHLGVSKVLAFTHNLTAEAMTVIKHYEDTGFLETMPFDFPQQDNPYRRVGQKNGQAWNDEQVVVYHCYDRLINFKFVGVIDFDEFIVPHKDENFPELFNRLLSSQKMASDFMFQHMVHVLEWNRTSSDSLIVAGYLNHTTNLGYNLKTVFMPDRVPEGKIFTHGLLKHLQDPGYRTIHVLKAIAQMSHYRRKCRPEWVKHNTCFKRKKQTTTRILELMTEELRTIIDKKKKLLIDKR